MTDTLYATAVSINGNGVLLSGESGSGKSDLALRLIDRGASLVCDDRVIVDTTGPVPLLRCPSNIAGKIEIRGIGIMPCDHVDAIPLRLAVSLDQLPERYPLENQTQLIAGYAIPLIALAAFEASAPIKIERALQSLVDANITPVASMQTHNVTKGL